MYTQWLVVEANISSMVVRVLTCYRRKHRMVLDGARELHARVEYLERQRDYAEERGSRVLRDALKYELRKVKELRKEYLDAETQRIVDTEAAFVALYDSLRKYD